jgi:hypothetical protein
MLRVEATGIEKGGGGEKGGGEEGEEKTKDFS